MLRKFWPRPSAGLADMDFNLYNTRQTWDGRWEKKRRKEGKKDAIAIRCMRARARRDFQRPRFGVLSGRGGEFSLAEMCAFLMAGVIINSRRANYRIQREGLVDRK